MLDVVVHLQGLSRLEPHELHSNCVEILYLLHIFGSDPNLLPTNWIEGADLIFVKNSSCFLTYETLGVPKRLIILGIHFLSCGLFGWHNRGIEAQGDLSFWSKTEKALALSSLAELLLPDSLHQLTDPVLRSLYPQHFRELFLLIETNDVGEKLFDIENWALLMRVRHREELYVNS